MAKSENQTINTFQLAFTYAGCFLGAGYVSGQEIWQYFGVYGENALTGFLTAIVLLGLSFWVVLALSRMTQSATIEPLIIRKDIPWLRLIFGLLTALLLFSTAGIMVAGISALLKQMMEVPEWIGALVVIVATAFCVYFGLSGMVRIFSLSVPVLILSAVVITVCQILQVGPSQIRIQGGEVNPLLGGWFVSAANYAAVNYFGAVAIIGPLAGRIKSPRSILSGLLIGSMGLISVAAGILFAAFSAPECIQTDIPMYYVASLLGSLPAWWYALLLVLAMFGNAVSSLVGTLNYMEEKSTWCKKRRVGLLLVLSLATYLSSLVGFGDLISVIYPVFGYVGLLVMVLISSNYFREVLKKHPAKMN